MLATTTAETLAWRLTSGRRLAMALLVMGFAILTGLSAQWEILLPFTPVPVTLQTLVVLLSGGVLGAGAGAASQGLYLLLGAVGLPFFSGGSSGIEVFVGPTSGYLLGFVVAAALVGRMSESRADRRLLSAIPAYLLGSLVIYVFGVGGLIVFADMGLGEAIVAGVVPFVVGDLVKTVIAGVGSVSVWSRIGPKT